MPHVSSEDTSSSISDAFSSSLLWTHFFCLDSLVTFSPNFGVWSHWFRLFILKARLRQWRTMLWGVHFQLQRSKLCLSSSDVKMVKTCRIDPSRQIIPMSFKRVKWVISLSIEIPCRQQRWWDTDAVAPVYVVDVICCIHELVQLCSWKEYIRPRTVSSFVVHRTVAGFTKFSCSYRYWLLLLCDWEPWVFTFHLDSWKIHRFGVNQRLL